MPHPVFHIVLTIVAMDIIATLWIKRQYYLPVMVTAILGSILPDIDIFFELVTLSGIFLFPQYLLHWGVFHSLLFPFFLACCSGLLFLSRQRTIALLVAILAMTSFIHLGMDLTFSFTAESGMKLLFPFSDQEFLLQAKNETFFKWTFVLYTIFISLVWLVGKILIITQPRTPYQQRKT